MSLDVLLVTAPSRLAVYQGLSHALAAIEPPVWSGLCAEALRRAGHSVAMLDAEALSLSHEATAQAIHDAAPRLAAFMVYGQQPSASTQCMPGAAKVARALRALGGDIATIVVGTHASALPERTLREEPYDYVCAGEGPDALRGLAAALRGERDVATVPGLWRLLHGQPVAGPPARNLADLDAELPRQAWDLLDMGRYRAHNWHCFHDLGSRGRYASLQTSLGCPYRCAFCCINAPFGRAGIRYWRPDTIIAQIDELVNVYGVANIKIPDEMFVLNKHHVAGICERIIERGYDLNLWAYARVDTLHDSLLEKLRRAGFRWLGIGVESASGFVRDGMTKGRFDEDDIRDAIARVRGHGICVGANYIFGLPDDTAETMRATLDLAQELNTEWANFYCAMAYPGSELYRIAKTRGYALPDDPGGPGWIGYSQHAREAMPLRTESLTMEQVLDFRDAAFQTYFTAPEYLAMLGRKFGDKAVEHVRAMTAVPLDRAHRAGRPLPGMTA
jgi:radical SAM superfamily enzyme YgiQ (UPF0313 family)